MYVNLKYMRILCCLEANHADEVVVTFFFGGMENLCFFTNGLHYLKPIETPLTHETVTTRRHK